MSISSPYQSVLAATHGERDEMFVKGSRTRYWTYGPPSDRTIVVVHGFRGDHHGLEPVIAHLGGARAVAPDLPGFGESTPFPAWAHTVEAYADWLISFVAQLPDAQAVVLLGHSFGSVVVAAALARGLPASATVLLNPIGAPALSGPRGILCRLAVLYYRLGAALPERSGASLLRSPLVVHVMSKVLSKSGQQPLCRWILAEHLRYFSVFADRQMVLEAFEATVGDDVSTYAAQITTPVLLVGGHRDDITPVAVHRRLVSLFPTAELVMIEGVGHLIHYEAPDQAAQAIQEFLAGAYR